MHILESQHSDLASDRITHSVVMVDAAIAARWLERNTRNRPLQATTVARYKRDMLDNRWNFAGDPIRFSVEGSLLDGQHRLAAIVDAETVIVPMLVVRGLADETHHLAMFIQAWNAWRSGRTMLKFQRPRGGAWSAVNYPVPR